MSEHAPRRRSDPFGLCQLCRPPRRVAAAALLDHLRIVHGLDEAPAAWPDGSLVIIDSTLEPADFEADP